MGVVAGLAALILVVVIWRYLAAQPHGKGKDRRELADALLFLVRLMENGGKLHARAIEHNIGLCFERVSGDDSSAVVSLEVEGELEPEPAARVGELLGAPDTAASQAIATVPGDARGSWKVSDLWDDGCVAPIVHRTWQILDALEVPPPARIDFSLDGPRSGRWTRRLRSEH